MMTSQLLPLSVIFSIQLHLLTGQQNRFVMKFIFPARGWRRARAPHADHVICFHSNFRAGKNNRPLSAAAALAAIPSASSQLSQPSIVSRHRKRMGATLSSRVEWTSASSKGGKLDFSKTNESILREIVRYVENLTRSHPREAQVVFKHPFVWTSPLSLSTFQSLHSGDEYELR